jgi:hypothetical protein
MLDRGSRVSRSKPCSKNHARCSSGLKRQYQGHQKAKVSALDPFMSKAPKRPSRRDDPGRQDVEAGVQRPKSTPRKARAAPKKANTALDSLSAEMPNGRLEGPEGNTGFSLPPAQSDTLASSGSLATEDNQNTPDQQGPYSRIGDEVEQPVQTVGRGPTEPHHGVAGGQPRPSEELEMQAAQKREPTQRHLIARDLKSESRGDRKRFFSIGLKGTVQQAIGVWSPRLQAASAQMRGASGRVKVWAQERSERREHGNDKARRSANPVYILGAITLGIPALLLIPLVGMNPGVQKGTFTTVATFLVVSAFVTAAVFEIKRLADQSSDEEHH